MTVRQNYWRELPRWGARNYSKQNRRAGAEVMPAHSFVDFLEGFGDSLTLGLAAQVSESP